MPKTRSSLVLSKHFGLDPSAVMRSRLESHHGPIEPLGDNGSAPAARL